ncbi:hypothetical protein N1851_022928 [Merluccius polli]|uniref:Uncharacterized protein n=1 Tax=Merluccius polli TaxID=89951 RepID=A0AA47MH48_MERPO|nr:hypothetical protein N1851_022928 [Merluccius polli]
MTGPLTLEKLQALGVKAMLFTAKPGKKPNTWLSEVLAPHCQLSEYAKICADRMKDLYGVLVRALWSQAGVPGENPRRHGENMQTPHRKIQENLRILIKLMEHLPLLLSTVIDCSADSSLAGEMLCNWVPEDATGQLEEPSSAPVEPPIGPVAPPDPQQTLAPPDPPAAPTGPLMAQPDPPATSSPNWTIHIWTPFLKGNSSSPSFFRKRWHCGRRLFISQCSAATEEERMPTYSVREPRFLPCEEGCQMQSCKGSTVRVIHLLP